MEFPLPADLIERIMMVLDLASVQNMMRVCDQFYQISSSGLVWKELVRTEFGMRYLDGREKVFPSWREVFRSVYEQKLTLPSYQSEGVMGCQHYQRKMMLRAECCHKFYSCRYCHDEHEDHKIDQSKTQTMICRTVQATSKTCSNCSIEMATYYCGICPLWTELPSCHCSKCGVCRCGREGIDLWHCDKCGICYPHDPHACLVQNGLKTICPICRKDELLFFSRESVYVLRCGHAIHRKCSEEFITRFDQDCPLCLEEDEELGR